MEYLYYEYKHENGKDDLSHSNMQHVDSVGLFNLIQNAEDKKIKYIVYRADKCLMDRS
jgi:hypothetical protein